MKITPKTKIIDMIDAHPGLVDVLVSYNRRFELLKNPVMRKTFARLATVGHAARVADVDLTELIRLLNGSIGEEVSDADAADAGHVPAGRRTEPADAPVKAIVEQRHAKTTSLDVRDVMRSGREPFGVIMRAAAKIRQGEALVLETIFEPAPLYDVLKDRGFEHQTEVLAEDHYRVWFYRTAEREGRREGLGVSERLREEDDTVYLDVRGLEPPGPMAMILETMAGLDPSKRLVVQHERIPMFLYPKLDEHGYRYETKELGPHSVQLVIRKG